jgi:hypothetical protein
MGLVVIGDKSPMIGAFVLTADPGSLDNKNAWEALPYPHLLCVDGQRFIGIFAIALSKYHETAALIDKGGFDFLRDLAAGGLWSMADTTVALAPENFNLIEIRQKMV